MDFEMLEEFKFFSSLVGRDFGLVQGAGGNTSIKLDDRRMLVKASGFSLSDAQKMNIFCNIDYEQVRKNLREGKPNPVNGAYDKDNLLRPSIETVLHAILDAKIVFHFHSLCALSWLVQKNVESELNNLLGDFDWVLVPYTKPGIELALKCVEQLERKPKANVILLQNHGLVIAGDTPLEVFELLVSINQVLSLDSTPLRSPNLKNLKKISHEIPFIPAKSLLAHQLALIKKNLDYATGGTLYPDHVVFLGPGVITCSLEDDISELIRNIDFESYKPVVLVNGSGVLVHQDISDAAYIMVEALAAVVSSIPGGVEVSYLTSEQEKELMFWEAETFRKKLNKV